MPTSSNDSNQMKSLKYYDIYPNFHVTVSCDGSGKTAPLIL